MLILKLPGYYGGPKGEKVNIRIRGQKNKLQGNHRKSKTETVIKTKNITTIKEKNPTSETVTILFPQIWQTWTIEVLTWLGNIPVKEIKLIMYNLTIKKTQDLDG